MGTLGARPIRSGRGNAAGLLCVSYSVAAGGGPATAGPLATTAGGRYEVPGQSRRRSMPETEGLGSEGLVALALVLLGVVVALTLGFAKLFYVAIVLTAAAFIVILALCAGRTGSS